MAVFKRGSSEMGLKTTGNKQNRQSDKCFLHSEFSFVTLEFYTASRTLLEE